MIFVSTNHDVAPIVEVNESEELGRVLVVLIQPIPKNLKICLRAMCKFRKDIAYFVYDFCHQGLDDSLWDNARWRMLLLICLEQSISLIVERKLM